VSDVTGILNSSNIQLEKQALDAFGAAVQNSPTPPLSDYFSVAQDNSARPTPIEPKPTGIYDIGLYAGALVKTDQVEFNPKLKFLFKVSFKFNPAMTAAANMLGYDLRAIEEKTTFMVRHIDRPKFDYQFEDVNLYNFRTKVLKAITHREVGFTLYDDVGNNVLSFINIYRKLQQPITRRIQSPSAKHEDYGFAFDSSMFGMDTAMRGILPGDAINILHSMTIHQIFVERGSTIADVGSWVKTVNFTFTNPRFTNIDIDDMDHENGANFNLITITSDFDTMHMSEPEQFTTSTAPSLASGDIFIEPDNRLSRNFAGGQRDEVTNLAVHQQNMTQRILRDTLATTPSGGGQESSMGGLTKIHGQKTIADMIKGSTTGTSRPVTPVVVDDSVSPQTARDLSSRE
jgi:hypothetical protein